MKRTLRKKISDFGVELADSPLVMVIFEVSTTVALALFSAVFSFEIVENGSPNWKIAHRATTFWPIIGLTLVLAVYHYLKWNKVRSLKTFSTKTGTRAYLRREAVPALAKAMVKKIKSGESPGDFEDIRDILDL